MRVTRVTNQVEARFASGAHLRIVGGPDAGAEFDIPPIGMVIGADPAADLCLADAAVSGRHCTVAPVPEGFAVKDLGSRNGTLIDGARVTEAVVPPGSVLRLGTTLVQLMPGSDVVEIPPSDDDSFCDLAGKSLAMRQVFSLLERASQSDASILFLGESGTGKELAARAVHESSPRRDQAMVTFDCGAASDTLIESSLFGHVKGAFTGATRDKVGAFAAAHGGTLFLDEIGDLPLELQPKLLRLLEAGEVTPLGSEKTEHYDVRVLAATHKDLFEEVSRGAFRADLYYRLAVVEVHLPPLRARKEDIPELARRFLVRAGAEDTDVSGPNLEKLLGYHWPGNVRELRNVISRAVALAGDRNDFSTMPVVLRSSPKAENSSVRADRPFQEAKSEVLETFERAYLADLLRRSGGNMSQAARLAGLERKHLYRLLDRLGMR